MQEFSRFFDPGSVPHFLHLALEGDFVKGYDIIGNEAPTVSVRPGQYEKCRTRRGEITQLRPKSVEGALRDFIYDMGSRNSDAPKVVTIDNRINMGNKLLGQMQETNLILLRMEPQRDPRTDDYKPSPQS